MFNYLSFPSPNTQKNTPLIFTFLSSYCSISLFDISTAFFKRINYMNFIFMSLNLPFIANLLQSGFQSPPTPLKLWPCSAGISVLAHPVDTFQFSSYKSQLHWPNWPVVSAGNTLCFAYVFVFVVPLRPLLTSVIFPFTSSCPTEVPELLTSWPLAFLSFNILASDITHCLGFRYYPYAFPSLLPVVETFLLNSILIYSSNHLTCALWFLTGILNLT